MSELYRQEGIVAADDAEDVSCGFFGKPHDPIHRDEFNNFLRRVRVHHLRPLHKELKRMSDAIEEHTTADAITQAKIAGGLTVIKIGIGVLSILLTVFSGVGTALVISLLKVRGIL